ncbi:hypothetical protein V6N12_012199 [Hibiscus sabdariffa]|uniref:Secreted protein n=1 Tax=Hibiscus sabdariffa TaxID=183260 RepID=A0ABR2CHG7_9ROSI
MVIGFVAVMVLTRGMLCVSFFLVCLQWAVAVLPAGSCLVTCYVDLISDANLSGSCEVAVPTLLYDTVEQTVAVLLDHVGNGFSSCLAFFLVCLMWAVAVLPAGSCQF